MTGAGLRVLHSALPDDVAGRIAGAFADLAMTDGPGAAVAVLKDGDVVWQACTGLASIEHDVPITPATRFHLVSASKPFTAAAMLLLESDHRLSIDDDIRDWLPELPEPLFMHGPITIRQLLNHTSGIRDALEVLRLRGSWRTSPQREADILDLAFATAELNAPPGRRYLYCNTGFVLAAEILRRASGLESADAWRRQALDAPLGLAATGARPSDDQVVPGLATGYVSDGQGGWRIGTNLLGIAGDVVTSSLEDMARWIGSWCAGAGYLRSMAQAALLADNSVIHYGLGVEIRRYRGLRVLNHPGSQPGWKAHVAHVPERGLGFVMLSNREDSTPTRRFPAVAEIMLDGGLPRRHPGALAEMQRAHTFIHMDKPARIDGLYANEASGELLWLTMVDGGFEVETLGDPVRLYPDGYGRFADADDYTATQPAMLAFEQTPPDAPPVCRATIGGFTARYVKCAPPVLDAFALRGYVGRYENRALGIVHEVALTAPHEATAVPPALTIRYAAGPDRSLTFPLAPVAPDLFLARPTAPGVSHRHVLHFTRNDLGDVTGALVTMERLKGLELMKIPSVNYEAEY